MDQCEDREEGVPPFKRNVMRLAAMYMKKCEAQSVRQTVERKHKPEPKPDPSCVSMKSDGSMNRPIRFDSRRIHQTLEYPEPKHKVTLKPKPDPSSVSMKSDGSMNRPIRFDSRRIHQKPEYPEPKTKLKHKPDPSCVSMKSDWSMDCPIKFDSRSCWRTKLSLL
ncbi:uncharacterized protein LOC125001026 isoform X3 [Mugil cephalus]|uniref:uncharacterized protein LOC125001026 isoform X3 n=1 Tax=Mugil cephalus TaxID=48193 RepID=UPI001FB7E993|nr:uncharacterized protein LOC125001026 isoform X3 [Mugil cephalus]